MTHEFDIGNTSLSGDFNMLTTKVREIENKKTSTTQVYYIQLKNSLVNDKINLTMYNMIIVT